MEDEDTNGVSPNSKKQRTRVRYVETTDLHHIYLILEQLFMRGMPSSKAKGYFA